MEYKHENYRGNITRVQKVYMAEVRYTNLGKKGLVTIANYGEGGGLQKTGGGGSEV